jgi:hypothetical protein
MRPWTARQKRFSFRVLQIAQLKGGTPEAGSSAPICHYGIFTKEGVRRTRMGSGFSSTACGKTA